MSIPRFLGTCMSKNEKSINQSSTDIFSRENKLLSLSLLGG